MQREYYIGVPIGVGVLIIIYIFGKKEHSDRAYNLLVSIVPFIKPRDTIQSQPDIGEDGLCGNLGNLKPEDLECCKIECKPVGFINTAIYCKEQLFESKKVVEDTKQESKEESKE